MVIDTVRQLREDEPFLPRVEVLADIDGAIAEYQHQVAATYCLQKIREEFIVYSSDRQRTLMESAKSTTAEARAARAVARAAPAGRAAAEETPAARAPPTAHADRAAAEETPAGMVPLFACTDTFCNELFTTEEGLREHLQQVHNGHIICPTCFALFNNRGLEYHDRKIKRAGTNHLPPIYSVIKRDECTKIEAAGRPLVGFRKNDTLKSTPPNSWFCNL